MLTTARLKLRRLRPDDAPWVAALDCDPAVMLYIREASTPERALEDAERRIEWDARHQEFGLWAMEDRTGVVHGWVGLKPFELVEVVNRDDIELGFRLKRASWGQGLAREAGERLVEYGFSDLGLARIQGVAHKQNAASKRVLEHLRFDRRVSNDPDWDFFERLLL